MELKTPFLNFRKYARRKQPFQRNSGIAAILNYSSHSEPNGLNRNKTVFSVTFQSIKNPKKPYNVRL